MLPNRSIDVLAIGETMALVTPQRAESLEIAEDFSVEIGGAESNVACHLAHIGHRVEWFSALGDDALGRRTRARIAAHGVDTARVVMSPEVPTGLYVKNPGVGVTYYRRGSAASRLGPADLERIDWSAVRTVHLSGITPALSESCRALVNTAIDAAHANGVTVSFDVNLRSSLWSSDDEAAVVLLDIARRSDVVLVGRDEAEMLWGPATADDVRALFPATAHLVVKDADVEAVEFSEAGRIVEPAHRIEVVEPVGAGDAFAAGWLSGLLLGEDSAARLRGGHSRAASALASTKDVPMT